jgi:hypothetical protein
VEFINKNYFDTTTKAVVNSATATVENLMLRDVRFQYVSSGFNNDLTNTTIVINFDETQTVSRIALLETNIKDFTIYYNGVTANTFSLTATGATTVSDFSSNSESSLYLSATPVACTSLSIDILATQVANQEKAIGYLGISRVLSNLDGRVPSAQKYRPRFEPKQVIHELADGSYRSQVFDRKYSVDLGLDFLSDSATSDLKSVFDLHDDFIFVAFPTTTSWDEVIFPCIWANGFDFEEFTDNAAASGHSGSIRLLETRPR